MGIVGCDPAEGGVGAESSATTQLSDQSFDQMMLANRGLMVVDFWTQKSGPSSVIASVLKELADASGGQVTLATVDVDRSPALAARYSVRSIPTILFMKKGEVVDRVIGDASKALLEMILNARA